MTKHQQSRRSAGEPKALASGTLRRTNQPAVIGRPEETRTRNQSTEGSQRTSRAESGKSTRLTFIYVREDRGPQLGMHQTVQQRVPHALVARTGLGFRVSVGNVDFTHTRPSTEDLNTEAAEGRRKPASMQLPVANGKSLHT